MNRDMTKGARFSFYGMQLILGSVFWTAASSGHFVMSEEVYGRAVDWPAKWWALAMLFPAATYLAALFVNGRRRWTPYIRVVAGCWMLLYYSTFIAFGLPSAGVDLIVIASGVFALKAGVMLAFDCADIKRKRHDTLGRP